MANRMKRLAEWAGIVPASRYNDDDDDFSADDETGQVTEAVTEAVTAAVPVVVPPPPPSRAPAPRAQAAAPVVIAPTPPGVASMAEHRTRRAAAVREASFDEIVFSRPRSYSADARRIAEAYRDGVPQFLNLSEMDSAEAYRLVDFISGLHCALDGSLEKISARLLMLLPPGIRVTDRDKERIATDGLVAQA